MGAGQGQHYQYVKQDYSEYLEIDLRPRHGATTSGDALLGKRATARKFLQSDCSNLPFLDNESVDRVIATCLLVHLADPEQALCEWRRIIKHQGRISLWVALEPGLLLRLLQKVSTKRKYAKYGYEYESIHYREHVQHYPRMRMLINEVFRDDKVKRLRFPFPRLWWHLNLVEIYQIEVFKHTNR